MERQFSLYCNDILLLQFKLRYSGLNNGEMMISLYKKIEEPGVPLPVVIPEKAWMVEFNHPHFNSADEMHDWDQTFAIKEAIAYGAEPFTMQYSPNPYSRRYAVMLGGECTGIADLVYAENKGIRFLSAHNPSLDINLPAFEGDTDTSLLVYHLRTLLSQNLPGETAVTFVAEH